MKTNYLFSKFAENPQISLANEQSCVTIINDGYNN
nr:MAG TPA: hypothetical protein [Caudoviricetes sp.]